MSLRRMLLAVSNAASPTKDAFFKNTTLLLNGDGTNGAQNNTFVDSSANNFAITRTGTPTQGSFSPFSPAGWGGYFNGTTDYVTIASDATNALGNVFTIEGFIYPTATGATQQVMVATVSGGVQVGYQSATQFGLCSSGVAWRLVSTTLPIVNTWNHFAVVRTGTGTNQTAVFLNGNRVALGTVTDAFTTTTGLRVGASSSAGEWFSGGISNVRNLKGVALYDPASSTYAVPTAPLTAITGTSLLTLQDNRFKDNSANNFALTVTGTPGIQAFSPFAPSAAYQASTHGGSGYFNGTTDYVSAPSTTSFAFPASTDFTVEAWVYPLEYGGSVAGASILGTTDGATSGWSMNLGESIGGFRIISNASGAWADTLTAGANNGPPLNQWSHIAITRSGGTLSIWKNGLLMNSIAGVSAYNFTAPNNRAYSGYWNASSSLRFLKGYIAGARIVKGAALYTGSSYTVPSAPGTAITNTQLLLNFTNAGIADATGRNDLTTVGDAQISTAVTKFGTGSLKFDGVGDYLPIPSSKLFQFGTGDFTVEGWFFQTADVANPIAIRIGDEATTAGIMFNTKSSGVARIYSGAFYGSATTTLNGWNHIVWMRRSGMLFVYVNGSSAAGVAFTNNLTDTSTITIGSNSVGGATYSYTGYMDDLRVSNIARYSGTTITVPTASFPVQ